MTREDAAAVLTEAGITADSLANEMDRTGARFPNDDELDLAGSDLFDWLCIQLTDEEDM